ncbi:MAG: M1 family metallopeptidase [candidate division KSB1 bacterium]|nr:M1 family metallopeptidase [candidate division KSB1 bacterium]MDZ7274659.1 M1 family metallopeptidase [candidate division KSB1 bacterium]MDZ7285484.1 M1 family metallopeptidase [candidate division KSB1 bacterium]MDZ7298516.1 M1 family metallopeptidase [candidate division KSB1 bacterium]MDZ7306260.1 M1 family metallopeptidase [candidate division KSB1 bacterium]
MKASLEFRRGRVAVLFGLALSAVARPAVDGYPRQPAFDVWHYRLRLEFAEASDHIQGEATLAVIVRDAGDSTLHLNLKSMTVTQVLSGRQRLAFTPDAEGLTVTLPPHRRRGDTLAVTIAYHGVPQEGLVMRKNKFGRRVIFADNWPDYSRHWFPGIDHPSDKAAVDFHLTLPAHYTVVANGRLVAVTDAAPGMKVWHWRERAPIPTYCMVFGAAAFAVTHLPTTTGVPVAIYAYPEDAADVNLQLSRTAAMLEFFTNRFGVFPYEKLALVQAATRYGGMENAGAIFLAEQSFGKDREVEHTAAHEIAHQWFGDAVTPGDWHHLWLSEGFATYGTALFYEHIAGPAEYRAVLRDQRAGYLQAASRNPAPILDTTITDYRRLLSANNYAKAAWVLHMLRGVVGESHFGEGMRRYYSQFKHGTALSSDFQAVMEKVSGMDLAWFFAQWLQQPGHPELQVDWQWQPARRQVQVRIRQTQSGALFRLPLQVALQVKGREARHEQWIAEREVTFALPAQAAPEALVIDPEEKILMQVQVRKTGQL